MSPFTLTPRRLTFLVALVSVLGVSAPGVATVTDPAWINLTPDLSDGPVQVSIHSDGSGIQGWSFGICFDPNAAELVRAEPTIELRTVRSGNPPAYMVNEVGTTLGRSGYIQAVVLDFGEPVSLPAAENGGFPILDLEFNATDDAELSICSGLRGTGEAVQVVTSIDGASYTPAFRPSTTVIPKPEAWFGITPEVSNGSVTVFINSRTESVQGWSFTLCHDPEKAIIKRFGPTRELWTQNGGNSPDFYWSEEADNETGAGIIQAAVPTFGDIDSVPTHVEGGFPCLLVEYEVLEETTVTFCPGVEGTGRPVELVATIAGFSARLPMQQARTTLIVDPYADTLAFRAEPELSDEVVTLKLYSEEAPVEAWSVAFCHTRANADLLEVQTSPELGTIDRGEPPRFIKNEIVTVEPFEAVRHTVILGTELHPRELGPFPDGLALVDLRYDVHADDSLKFCDHVGSVTFENSVTIDSVDYKPRTRTGARLVTGGLTARFIRGDADLSGRVNIADPVMILVYLFSDGPAPACMDAADGNDVARVDIADAIYLLNYLFVNGPPPPPPFPNAGRDLSPETALGCDRGL